jgi:hypothetical protein
MSNKTDVFFSDLEKKFPHCIFTKRGNKVILNDGSFVNDLPAFDMTKINKNYKFGVHKDLWSFVDECGFATLYSDKNDVTILKK